MNNTDKLEEWSNMKEGEIIYDSDCNGWSQDVFINTVENRSNCYFIAFTDENYVFGGFSPSKEKLEDTFLFTFNENGIMNKVKKYNIIDKKNGGVKLSKCTHCLFSFHCGISIYPTGERETFASNSIGMYYKDAYKRCITGTSKSFDVERIVVIQMI